MTTSRDCDVAVIGAGVTGLATAYRLSLGGLRVVVYERERIAAQASGVQPGGVRQQWGTAVNCQMSREAYFFYRDLQAQLGSTVDTTFRSCGYLFLAESNDALEQLSRNVELQNSFGIPSEVLYPREVARIAPELVVDTLQGAAYCEQDGYFDSGQAPVEAFAEAAVRNGCEILYGEVVEIAQRGQAWKVRLADGSTSTCAHVLVAAGYDTPALLAPLGIDMPIQKEPRYLFFSQPIRERLLDPLVIASERGFAAKQMADGRVLASDLTATGDQEEGRAAWRKRIDEQIEHLLPRLQFVTFPLLVEGFYDMTPDGQPVLGPVEGSENLWIAAGFSGHGFMMAPAMSDRLARAILDDQPAQEFEVFALQRFQQQALVPETGVF